MKGKTGVSKRGMHSAGVESKKCAAMRSQRGSADSDAIVVTESHDGER